MSLQDFSLSLEMTKKGVKMTKKQCQYDKKGCQYDKKGCRNDKNSVMTQPHRGAHHFFVMENTPSQSDGGGLKDNCLHRSR